MTADGRQPAPAFDAIPAAMRDRAQWLVWRFEQGPGDKKPRKMPHYADGGRRVGTQGDARDLRRLVTLERVRQAFERGTWDGIGFAFLPGDGLVGIDLDDAIDADGVLAPLASEIVDRCASFTELSPSGRGLHVYGAGVSERHKVNAAGGRIGVEIFAGAQFFCVTGRHFAGTPDQVVPLEVATLERLHAIVDELRAARAAPRPPAPPPAAGPAPGPGDRARELREALDFVGAGEFGHDDWLSVGMSLRAELGDAGFELWDAWSARDADRYPGADALRRRWATFDGAKPGNLLFQRAYGAGWKGPARPGRRSARAPAAEKKRSRQPAGGNDGQPPPADPPPFDTVPPGEGDPPKKARLQFPFCNDSGQPKPTFHNVVFALLNDPKLTGLVYHNDFSELHEKDRATPWGTPAGEWTTEDDLQLATYLAHNHRLVISEPKQIQHGVTTAAFARKRHPIRDYLSALEWDGTERLDHWLVDLIGAPDSTYTRLAGRFFFLSLIARVMRPGCQMDHALIFQGEQGRGKSSSFRIIGGKWFAETPFKIGDKDSYMSLQGVWLYELSELDSLSRAESTAVKSFLSSKEDRYRPPYGARVVMAKRRTVLCGTTNSDQFLKDPTGDRRFWPVQSGEINLAGLEAARDQLFAEAVVAFEKGGRWWPSREEEHDFFVPEQDRWRQVDVWADVISAYVNDDQQIRHQDEDGDDVPQSDRVTNAERTFFSTQELMTKALRIDVARIDRAKQMQTSVSNCMRELGFRAGRQPSGKRKRGYFRTLAARNAAAAAPLPGSPGDPKVRAKDAVDGQDVPF